MQSSLTYQLTRSTDGLDHLVIYDDSFTPYLVNSDHPQWEAIRAGVLNDDNTVLDLIDVGSVVARSVVSDRVAYDHNKLYFDGDEIAGELVDHILKSIKEKGQDATQPLINFLEKLQQNPSENSRNQLYRFLNKHNFTINEDGDFVGYKGVNPGEDDYTYFSTHSGPAIVNGVPHKNGPVPQTIGDVVEMARSSVADDPSQACSTGLHVANWHYASGFSRIVLAVIVNPRDVVSVPTDSNDEKIRVCRYRIWKQVTKEFNSSITESYGNHPNCEEFDLAYDDWEIDEYNYYNSFKDYLVLAYGWKYQNGDEYDRTSWIDPTID